MGNDSGGGATCPVTPAAGRWLGAFDRHPYDDPYVIELHSDGQRLSGEGCIGGPPFTELPLVCAPLRVIDDRGRKLAFAWDLTQGQGGYGSGSDGYLAELDLTLSPERTALSGTLRLSDGAPVRERVAGLDALFVRASGDAVPDATSCSDGPPSGECFLHPLRADIVDPTLTATPLGDGDLLLSWTNRRASEQRLALAYFDGAQSEWKRAHFLDRGEAQGFLPVVGSSNGHSIAAFRRAFALVARRYDPANDVWSEPELAIHGDENQELAPESIVVDGQGNATLIGTTTTPGEPVRVLASDYRAAAGAWSDARLLGHTIHPGGVAVAGDALGNAVVAWLPPERPPSGRFAIWFSLRSAGEDFREAGVLYEGERQILNPAVAMLPSGLAVATWEEAGLGIASSSLPIAGGSWSEATTVAAEPMAQNRELSVRENGSAVAHFYRSDRDTYHASELGPSGWAAPIAALAAEADGETHVVTQQGPNFRVSSVRAGNPAIPLFVRASCHDY